MVSCYRVLVVPDGLMLLCIGSSDGLMLSCIGSSDGMMLSYNGSSDGLMLSCIGSSDGLMLSCIGTGFQYDKGALCESQMVRAQMARVNSICASTTRAMALARAK